MTIEQHAEAAASEYTKHLLLDDDRCETCITIIAKHMQSAIDEATAEIRESWLRAARDHAELWDFIQQSHESICEAAGVECVLDDAMVDLVPVAVNAITKLKARIDELEQHYLDRCRDHAACNARIVQLEGLGPLIEEILNFTGDVAAMPVDQGIEHYRRKAASILKGGAS